MPGPVRPLAFILASTDHGVLIVNRFDQHTVGEKAFGVGYQLLSKASYDPEEISLLLKLLDLRRKYYGDGVVAVDCGANLGVHTIEWAKHMTGWGAVLAFEAQERIYYALAGNLAINNCFNARAVNAAVLRQSGSMKIPQPNYLIKTSFGSIELTKREHGEFVGQAIDYSEDKMAEVRMVHLDALKIPRLDLLKIDVEGMELDVLAGAAQCIAERRPILLVEYFKSDVNALRAWLENLGYSAYILGLNFIAIHKDDKCRESITINTPTAA
jgi:FkbM family methyltransferase